MNERIKLDPLINRQVIFKLRGQKPMDATILGFDDAGYWVRGGELAKYLAKASSSDHQNEVQFLEFTRIEWLQATPSPEQKNPN
jgi:hypothetical protein